MFSETVAPLLVDTLKKLLLTLVSGKAGKVMTDFWKRRKIEGVVERCAVDTAESLAPYFEHERISEDAQRLIVECCGRALRPLTEEPQKLLRGSLDADKVFELAHPGGVLPEEVVHEGVGPVYHLVARQVCRLLCEMPDVLEGWELAKWAENYHRLDDVSAFMKDISTKLDARERVREDEQDRLLGQIRRLLDQRIAMNLTGLRTDRPVLCSFEAMFVPPTIRKRPRSRGLTLPAKDLRGERAAEEVLAPGVRAVVWGEPGAGKTTWCQWLLAQTVAGAAARAGILVRLRSVNWNDPPGPLTLLRQLAGPALAELVTLEHLTQWIRRQALVVLVDGFDEVPPSLRSTAWRWVVGLGSAVEQCPLIVTSRPIASGELDTLAPPWQAHTLLPFDEGQVLQFIQNWVAHAWPPEAGGAPIEPVALAASWSKDPTIAPFTGNPLLLSTLLVVHKLERGLPEGRAQLYRSYVHGMIGIWGREVETPGVTLSDEQKRAVLTDLALYMHLHEVEEIDEPTATGIVRDALVRLGSRDEAGVVLRMLHERTGLFVGPGTYSFAHKSIGEYLVAEAVVQGDRVGEDGRRVDRWRLHRERHNDRWKTVMFLWAGMAPVREVEDFLESLAERLDRVEVAVLGGLLLDQGQRLPASTRAQLLTRVIRAPIPPAQEGEINYVRLSGGGFSLGVDAPSLLTLAWDGQRLDALLSKGLQHRDLPPRWPQPGLSIVGERALWCSLPRALAHADVPTVTAWATGSPWADEAFDWAVASMVSEWVLAQRASEDLRMLIEALARHDPHAVASGTFSLIECVAVDARSDPLPWLELIASLRASVVGQVLLRQRLVPSRSADVEVRGELDTVDLLAVFESFLQRGVEGLDDAVRDDCLALTRHLRAARDT